MHDVFPCKDSRAAAGGERIAGEFGYHGESVDGVFNDCFEEG